ncbi:restriction endonuclease [beta proteobacterium AAP99]|nr:restriction endonuclease [beta proteobacterium AAP99]
MPIPDYESLMLPLLKMVEQRGPIKTAEVTELLASALGLTDEERALRLPSGQTTTLRSRVGWAKTYLKQAGLLEQPTRGVIKITPSGIDLLRTGPSAITSETLKRYPSFVDFTRRSRKAAGDESDMGQPDRPSIDGADERQTPEDALAWAAASLDAALRSEVLDQLKRVSPAYFEDIVVQLLLRMGYGGSRAEAGQAVGRSGDGGIDGIINEDRLGLDAVYIQAKRWEGVVGRPEIMKFVGALAGQRANKGVFITTSGFTREAREYAQQSQYRIVLLDGDRIAQLMVESGLGVAVQARYEIKKIDLDFFSEDE